MRKKRRKWTASEKMQVLQDAELHSVSESSRRHGVSSNMIYRWRTKYESAGAAGLEKSGNSSVDLEKKELHREIERLRQVVADQALTIRIKDELLKKTRYR